MLKYYFDGYIRFTNAYLSAFGWANTIELCISKMKEPSEEKMSDLQSLFETAVAESKNLSSRPNNDTLLKIYSLYKQGTSGDVSGKRPGMFDMVGRAKYDAWAKLQGTGQEDAMQQYVDLINSLKG